MIAKGLRFSRYEVGDRLGKGGFGVVHFARDIELGRELAIKFLRPEYQAKPKVVQRFLQEARAAARIGHPGIVTVFECGQVTGTGRADGTAFIAMELLKGDGLGDRLDKDGRLPLELAISIGRQLASGLATAHKAGIVHRDLKPDNVFLVPDPAVRGGVRVKILDFGVAKLAEAAEGGVHTHSQVILGTPRYMSPEQARSSARADHRSDIYALGCILYEIMCGRPPYSGDAAELLIKHQSADIPSPRATSEATTPELDQLISRMLAKVPNDRPQSMAEVDAALGECEALALAPRASRPPTGEERTLADPVKAFPPDSLSTTPFRPLQGDSLGEASVAAAVASTADSIAADSIGADPIAASTAESTGGAEEPGGDSTMDSTGGASQGAGAESVAEPLDTAALLPYEGESRGAAHEPDAMRTIPWGLQPAPPFARPGAAQNLANTTIPYGHAASMIPPRAPTAPGAPGRPVSLAGALLPGTPRQMGSPTLTSPDAPTLIPMPAIRGSTADIAARPPPPPRESSTSSRLLLMIIGGLISGGLVTFVALRSDHDPAPPSQTEAIAPTRPATTTPPPAPEPPAVPPSDPPAPAPSGPPAPSASDSTGSGSGSSFDAGSGAGSSGAGAGSAAGDAADDDAANAGSAEAAADSAESPGEAATPAPPPAARIDRAPKPGSSSGARAKAAGKATAAASTARPSSSRAAPCDAAALAEKGKELFVAGNLPRALAAYEASIACKPDPSTIQKAVIIACNMGSPAKARSLWRRLSTAMRTQVLGVCIRNGIDEDTLNRP